MSTILGGIASVDTFEAFFKMSDLVSIENEAPSNRKTPIIYLLTLKLILTFKQNMYNKHSFLGATYCCPFRVSFGSTFYTDLGGPLLLPLGPWSRPFPGSREAPASSSPRVRPSGRRGSVVLRFRADPRPSYPRIPKVIASPVHVRKTFREPETHTLRPSPIRPSEIEYDEFQTSVTPELTKGPGVHSATSSFDPRNTPSRLSLYEHGSQTVDTGFKHRQTVPLVFLFSKCEPFTESIVFNRNPKTYN